MTNHVPWAEYPSATNEAGEVLYCSVCKQEQRVAACGVTCKRGHTDVIGYPKDSPELKRVKDPARVKAGKKSKGKQQRTEQAVVKQLSGWWQEGEWKRTPLSGGWSRSRQALDEFGAAGDVVTTAANWPFCVEVKAVEGWDLTQLLHNPRTNTIVNWWNQTTRETPVGREPLLLFTKNHAPWHAMFRNAWLATLAMQQGSVWLVQVGSERVWLSLLDIIVQLSKQQVIDGIPIRSPLVA